MARKQLGSPASGSTDTTTKADTDRKVANYDGQSNIAWTGTQAAYDALSPGVKNAAGFIAVIAG